MNELLKSSKRLLANMSNMVIVPVEQIFNSQTIQDGKANRVSVIGGMSFLNLLPSVAQSISTGVLGTNGLEALMSEIIFISGESNYYKFLINPQNMRFDYQKLQSEEETSDITVINTYRNKAMPLSFSGVSGSLIPKTILKLKPDELGKLPIDSLLKNPRLSVAWMKFRQLEKFYESTNSDIAILFDMDLYVGKFVSFNYSMEAENPWQISYDISIKIYPDMVQHNIYKIWDNNKFFNAVDERYGRFMVDNFEGKFNDSRTLVRNREQLGV